MYIQLFKRIDYINENAFIPKGLISSTARKGDKWFTAVKTGDCVRCCVTGTDTEICKAVVTSTALLDYKDVLDSAVDNHVAYHGSPGDMTPAGIRAVLDIALKSAYGADIKEHDLFTKVFLLRLNVM